MICPGGQAALSSAFRALAAPGDPLLVESPTYLGALAAARAAGLRVVPVPADADGVRPDLLAGRVRPDRRPVVLLPAAVRQPARRDAGGAPPGAGAEAVRDAGAFLIEDDYARDLTIDGRAPPPLAADDPDGHVVYLRSLTKSAAPGLRVAAIGARGPAGARLRAARLLDDFFVAGPLQQATLEFVTAPAWARHRRALRTALRARREALLTALRRHLPELAPPASPAAACTSGCACRRHRRRRAGRRRSGRRRRRLPRPPLVRRRAPGAAPAPHLRGRPTRTDGRGRPPSGPRPRLNTGRLAGRRTGAKWVSGIQRLARRHTEVTARQRAVNLLWLANPHRLAIAETVSWRGVGAYQVVVRPDEPDPTQVGHRGGTEATAEGELHRPEDRSGGAGDVGRADVPVGVLLQKRDRPSQRGGGGVVPVRGGRFGERGVGEDRQRRRGQHPGGVADHQRLCPGGRAVQHDVANEAGGVAPLTGEGRAGGTQFGELDPTGPAGRRGGGHLRQHRQVQYAEFHLAGMPVDGARLLRPGDEEDIAGAEPVGRSGAGAIAVRGAGATDGQPAEGAGVDVEVPRSGGWSRWRRGRCRRGDG